MLALMVAALLIIPPAATAAWSFLQPSTYAAEVDLLHEPSTTSTADSVDRQLATHQVLMLRRSLLDEVARGIGRDPDELAANISVGVVGQSSVLRLRVLDQDKDRAQQATAVLADRYIDIADQLAASSDIGRVQIISPPAVLEDPVAPQPVRAAAGGGLLGLLLAFGLLALFRVRQKRSRHSAS